MSIDPGAVGRTSGPHPVRWTAKDAMLYALGVGAGSDDPARELAFTTENSIGMPQQVLPTFGVVISSGAPPIPVGTFDRSMSVHGEQSLECHRPLPPAGSGFSTTAIEGIYDKGSGALIQRLTTISDEQGNTLALSRVSQFIRGAGGFGGERGPASPAPMPTRAPDEIVEQRTRRDQALIYRLSGDVNPLHSDPAFAAKAGFARPILHGLCTFGFVGRAILGLLDGDTARFGGMNARFSAPVIPGDVLRTEFWSERSTLRFRTWVGERLVLDGGEAQVR